MPQSPDELRNSNLRIVLNEVDKFLVTFLGTFNRTHDDFRRAYCFFPVNRGGEQAAIPVVGEVNLGPVLQHTLELAASVLDEGGETDSVFETESV